VAGGSAGLYLIETDAFGERSFQYWRKDSAARYWLARLVENGESLLHGADIVYFSGITLAILNPDERAAAIELLRRGADARGVALHLIQTCGFRCGQSPQAGPRRPSVPRCRHAIIALPSAEDLAWLFGMGEPMRQMDLLMEMGVSEVALTLGAAGCAHRRWRGA